MLPKTEEDSANLACLCAILITLTSLITALIVLFFPKYVDYLLNAPEISKYLIYIPAIIFFNGIFLTQNYWLSRKTSFGVIAGSKVINSVSTGVLQLAIPIWNVSPLGLIVGSIAGYGNADFFMEHYSLADGYNPDFLGSLYHLPLPKLADNLQSKVAPLKDGGQILTYLHFSIVMNADRRLAFYTAANIDGKKLEKIKRTRDKWYFDPRLDQKYQAGPKLYEDNPLDRGHLVRRLDPCWGPNARDAGEDTFHFTNCSPQHKRLNQHG